MCQAVQISPHREWAKSATKALFSKANKKAPGLIKRGNSAPPRIRPTSNTIIDVESAGSGASGNISQLPGAKDSGLGFDSL